MPFIVETGLTEAQKRDRIEELNILHRRWTRKQFRGIIARRLKANLELDDTALAKMLGTSDKTVASVRRELAGRSEIPNDETLTDSCGRTQPRKKRPRKKNMTPTAAFRRLQAILTQKDVSLKEDQRKQGREDLAVMSAWFKVATQVLMRATVPDEDDGTSTEDFDRQWLTEIEHQLLLEETPADQSPPEAEVVALEATHTPVTPNDAVFEQLGGDDHPGILQFEHVGGEQRPPADHREKANAA